MKDQITLSDWLESNDCSMGALGRSVGCSGEHIGRICKDDPRVSQSLALRIFDKTGVRVGPLCGLSPSDIAVIRRINNGAAA